MNVREYKIFMAARFIGIMGAGKASISARANYYPFPIFLYFTDDLTDFLTGDLTDD